MLKIGLYGLALTALCCFTPLLVGLMVGLGFAHLVVGLDQFLVPVLVVFAVITIIGYFRRPKEPEAME